MLFTYVLIVIDLCWLEVIGDPSLYVLIISHIYQYVKLY